MAYALVEYVFGTIGPLVWTDERMHVLGMIGPLVARHHTILTAAQWRGTALLFGCYFLLGVLTGLASLLIPGDVLDRPASACKLITLSLVAGFGVHLFFIHLPASGYLPTITALAFIGAAVWKGKEASSLFTFARFPSLVACLLIMSASLIGRLELHNLSIALGTLATLLALLASSVSLRLAERSFAILARYFPAGLRPRPLGIALIAGLSVGAWMDSSTASPRALGSMGGGRPAALRPNIVLITLDTVRADHMGIYGYERRNTPNLRSFAQQSTLYSRFVAAAPLTLTSHASIFTGLYPQSHGAFPVRGTYPQGRPLADSFPTLATILRGSGYLTLGVMANNTYLRSEFGLTRGFDFADVPEPVQIVSGDRPYLLKNALRHIVPVGELGQDLDRRYITAREVNQRAYRLLERAGRQRASFFLFLNYMDAHSPYEPPPPFDRLYPGKNVRFDGPDYDRVAAQVNDTGKPLDSRVRAHLTSQYDGAIAYLDSQLGELISYLKHTGQYDHTLIVITSDHGESFGLEPRNFVGHDTSVYQNEVGVPLIIKYPNTSQGQRDDRLAGHVDLLPTILEVAGLPPLPGAQGVSLLRSNDPTTRYVVSEFHASASFSGPRFAHRKTALYWDTYKMIYSAEDGAEVYNLKSDPQERTNLFRTGDPIAELITAKLREWSRQTPPKYLRAEPSLRKAAERLDSLGYAHTPSQ